MIDRFRKGAVIFDVRSISKLKTNTCSVQNNEFLFLGGCAHRDFFAMEESILSVMTSRHLAQCGQVKILLTADGRGCTQMKNTDKTKLSDLQEPIPLSSACILSICGLI